METQTFKKIELQKGVIVFIAEISEREGKVIVEGYGKTWSYSWGAAGDKGIIEFLKSINSDYFAGKLCNEMMAFSAKESLKKFKRELREEMEWYEHLELQKELRGYLREIENNCTGFHEFMEEISALPRKFTSHGDRDRQDFKSSLENVCLMPHDYLDNDYTDEYKWLMKIHKELVAKLKKLSNVK